MTTPDDSEWLAVEDAADALGIGTRQVHRYGQAGRIRTEQRGRRVVFNRADVEALAAELGAARGVRPQAPRQPKAELVPAGQMLDYLRQRDAELAENQRRLETALLEVGRLRAEVERRALPEDTEGLRVELASVKAERDALRQQLDTAPRAQPRYLWAVVAALVLLGVLVLLRLFGVI
jgi:excisionase family DNA binding protein